MEGVALEVAALKGSEVGQEERREGSPGKGGLGRSCLGFGNLGVGGVHTGRHTDRRDKQRRLSLVIIQTHTLILPDPPTEPQQPPSSDHNFTPKESPEEGVQAETTGSSRADPAGGEARGGAPVNSSVPNLAHSGPRAREGYRVPGRRLSLPPPRLLQPAGTGVLPTPARDLARRQARGGRTCRAEAPGPRPAPGEGAGPREGEGACLQTRGRERGEGALRAGRRAAGPRGTLTPPAVAHPVPASLPRLRLRGLLLSGRRRRRRRGIQPGPPPPPPGRDPTMHLFSHPHRPTLPRGMPRREEGRTSRPRHDAGEAGAAGEAPGARGAGAGAGRPSGGRGRRGRRRGGRADGGRATQAARAARRPGDSTGAAAILVRTGSLVASSRPLARGGNGGGGTRPPRPPVSSPAPAVPSGDPRRCACALGAGARWGRGGGRGTTARPGAVAGAPPCW